MKTKTQQQLEKEIEEQKKNFDNLADFVKPQVTEKLKYLKTTGMNLDVLPAKLSQHLTDIKQIEKYLDMRLKDFKERKPKLIDDISKYAMQMSIDLLKEIKEALKEL